MRRHPTRQAELTAAGEDIAGKVGAEFKAAKIKARETAEEKMTRKGYRSTAQLTDVVRGRLHHRHAGQGRQDHGRVGASL